MPIANVIPNKAKAAVNRVTSKDINKRLKNNNNEGDMQIIQIRMIEDC